jgi:hypothetical protein
MRIADNTFNNHKNRTDADNKRMMRIGIQIPKSKNRIIRIRIQILLTTASASTFSPLIPTVSKTVPTVPE